MRRADLLRMRPMKLARLSFGAALAATLVTAGCPAPAPVLPPKPPGPMVKNVSLGDVGLDPAAMDKTADPCGDFYQYACGNWVKNTKIPSDQSRWMRSFSEIQKRNEEDLKAILEGLAAPGGAHSPPEQQVGDFYASCVDQKTVDDAGLGDVAGLLERVRGLTQRRAAEEAAKKAAEEEKEKDKDKGGKKGHKGGPVAAPNKFPPKPGAKPEPPKAPDGPYAHETLEHLVADLHRHGIFPFFDIASGPDDKDATTYIAQMDQNGLGLPDRDYYDQKLFADVRAYYLGHVEAMLRLLDMPADEAKRAAEQVMGLETKLAAISKTRVERRDPQKMYNRIDKAGLAERGKTFDYAAYLDTLVGEAQNGSLGVRAFNKINVTSVPYFEKLNEVVAGASAEELGHYLTWQVIHATADTLPKKFDEENFKLLQKITGQPQQKPRWKRCVAAADDALGELLGQAYVQKRFSAESKEAVKTMVMAIRSELEHRFPTLAWMDPKTREQAIAKLGKMEYLVGYPDKWREYPFAVDRASYVGNMMRASAYEFERRLARVEKPVDRGEWLMTPQTVNAYYDPNMNRMVFPAGILQAPFFAAKAALAVNMGSLGMVVGHEMTHGFDDQGSQYDGAGNLQSWWDPEVKKKFDDKAGCIADQYNYEVLPGVKQDGKLTLGENIADNAGVMFAFKAFTELRKDAPEVQVADGFDERQQFFLAVGQMWCSKVTDEVTKMRATTDPHSQPRWRVNGSLRNLPAFAEAFSCKAGADMHPQNACAVW